jgi:glycosyltransferase involved in cell wall biosynthesis
MLLHFPQQSASDALNSPAHTTTAPATGHSLPGPRARVCIVQPIIPHYRVPVFERLAEQPGIDLEVWAGTGEKGSSLAAASPSEKFRFVPAPQKRIGPFISQPRQIEAVSSGRFDVVILSWNARYLQLSKALRAARKHGVRTIIWGHGYSKHENWLRRFNRDRFLRNADACLVYNNTAAHKLIARGHPQEKVFVALNAIDQTPIAHAREKWLAQLDSLKSFQHEHGLSATSACVLFVSRLEPDKRVDLLLEAFAKVVHARPDARLVIIGRGPEQSKLESMATSLGISKAVRFTGAIYEEDQLAPWFLSASVFAYPKAIGLSILHAFGYGIPVVTCDDIPSHNPEIEALRPGENGLLYRHGDTAAFANAILRILENPEEQERMRAAARHTITGPDGFTIDRMVQGFTDAIHDLRGTQTE